MTVTKEVIDQDKIGKRGYLRNYAAYGMEPPKKIVPVVDGEPQTHAPAMTLQEYAAAKRFEKEIGGIIVGGAKIATDDRSKMMIAGAYAAAQENPHEFSTRWKAADGIFITVDAPAIFAIAAAVQAHVAACFALEDSVISAIDAGTITTYAEIDTAFSGHYNDENTSRKGWSK